MAELADALVSGISGCTTLQVQVLFPAPTFRPGFARPNAGSLYTGSHPMKPPRTSSSSSQITVGVRQLLNYVEHHGALKNASDTSLASISGSRLHQIFYQRFQEQYPSWSFSSEVPLEGLYSNRSLELKIRGRADLIIHTPDHESDWPIEVKSTQGPLSDLSPDGFSHHWAQVRLYAYLLLQKEDRSQKAAGESEQPSPKEKKDSCRYALAYISAQDQQFTLLERSESIAELEAWAQSCCQAYLSMALDWQQHLLQRNASIQALKFPYRHLREGQRDFMEMALLQMRKHRALLVEAPTGIGKTIASLYPAIKALGRQIHQRIFYLTAKRSTSVVARHTVERLTEEGLVLRHLQMTAKEQLCLAPQVYCEAQLCPYAQHYYERSRLALHEGLLSLALNESIIRQLAQKYRCCPFELQLDLAAYCDLIIGDYNYAFDPRIKLDRFFSEDPLPHCLLIDEAHNLPDRSRDMYSQQICEKQILALHQKIQETRPDLADLSTLLAPLEPLRQILDQGQTPTENLSFTQEEASFMQGIEYLVPGFLSSKHPPQTLIQFWRESCSFLRALIDEIDDLTLQKDLKALYFDLLFFLRLADSLWHDAFRFLLRWEENEEGHALVLQILCLDASDFIVSTYYPRHSAIFFSATLSPMSWFQRNLCGRDRDRAAEELILDSPFPRENRLVILHHGIATEFRERQQSLPQLAKSILLAAKAARGNCLVFFPSYAYLQQCLQLCRLALEKQGLTCLIQKRDMKQQEQAKFLAHFKQTAKPVIAFAVLGGSFSEGIDLVGEQLKAVVVVGTGLPGLSLERDLLRFHYDEEGEDGFAFAYRYPGLIRVLQAAGRLIRSEHDRGFIILIDRRYESEAYAELLPSSWWLETCPDQKKLAALLQENRWLTQKDEAESESPSP